MALECGAAGLDGPAVALFGQGYVLGLFSRGLLHFVCAGRLVDRRAFQKSIPRGSPAAHLNRRGAATETHRILTFDGVSVLNSVLQHSCKTLGKLVGFDFIIPRRPALGPHWRGFLCRFSFGMVQSPWTRNE